VPSITPPVIAPHADNGAGISESKRELTLKGPNPAAKRPAIPRAGEDSITNACHLAVDRFTGNALVQEREASFLLSARRRETKMPAAKALIPAKKRVCRCNQASVANAASLSA
jgi:hypothetical protein